MTLFRGHLLARLLEKLLHLNGKQAVLYRSRMNPGLGRNSEAVDPLEWLARMAGCGKEQTIIDHRRAAAYPRF